MLRNARVIISKEVETYDTPGGVIPGNGSIMTFVGIAIIISHTIPRQHPTRYLVHFLHIEFNDPFRKKTDHSSCIVCMRSIFIKIRIPPTHKWHSNWDNWSCQFNCKWVLEIHLGIIRFGCHEKKALLLFISFDIVKILQRIISKNYLQRCLSVVDKSKTMKYVL